MKILPVRTEFFLAEGKTYRNDEANCRFLRFAKAPKSDEISYSGLSVSTTRLVKRRTRFLLIRHPYKLKRGLIKKGMIKVLYRTACFTANSLQQKDSALLKAGNSDSRVGSLKIG
jgi:hypothetical protein